MNLDKNLGILKKLNNSDLKARSLRVAEIYRCHGISQAQVAKFVGASQPQVSRLLAGNLTRPSRLFEEICLYAERLDGGVTIEAVRANEELMAALAETWDGTSAHAQALAVVVRSLAVLRLVKE